jgi:hypothetical protein
VAIPLYGEDNVRTGTRTPDQSLWTSRTYARTTNPCGATRPRMAHLGVRRDLNLRAGPRVPEPRTVFAPYLILPCLSTIQGVLFHRYGCPRGGARVSLTRHWPVRARVESATTPVAQGGCCGTGLGAPRPSGLTASALPLLRLRLPTSPGSFGLHGPERHGSVRSRVPSPYSSGGVALIQPPLACRRGSSPPLYVLVALPRQRVSRGSGLSVCP